MPPTVRAFFTGIRWLPVCAVALLLAAGVLYLFDPADTPLAYILAIGSVTLAVLSGTETET